MEPDPGRGLAEIAYTYALPLLPNTIRSLFIHIRGEDGDEDAISWAFRFNEHVTIDISLNTNGTINQTMLERCDERRAGRRQEMLDVIAVLDTERQVAEISMETGTDSEREGENVNGNGNGNRSGTHNTEKGKGRRKRGD